jgi:glycosyltransferase involved in cell wall biosynthesis
VELALLNWMPELRGKTRVIFNGARLHFERVLHRQPKERLKVLSIGNLRPAKNYDNVLRAIALLGDLDFEYHIAGKGECLDDLWRLCGELGLESKVRFLGYVEVIPELLASADIFLMPSRWEGFGLAAVDAMNASLPLVVSNVPGLREIVNGGQPCALLVDPDSPEAIAAGVRHLLASPELRLQFGKNAFERAQKFSLDQMVKNYMELYGELIQ